MWEEKKYLFIHFFGATGLYCIAVSTVKKADAKQMCMPLKWLLF